MRFSRSEYARVLADQENPVGEHRRCLAGASRIHRSPHVYVSSERKKLSPVDRRDVADLFQGIGGEVGLPRDQLIERLIRAGELETCGGDRDEIDAYFDRA